MNEKETRTLDELWEELEKARQAEREEAERMAAAEQARDEEANDNS